VRPVFRYGSMPDPVVKFHKMWRKHFIEEAGEEEEQLAYAEVFECDSPDEVYEYSRMHPLLGDHSNPDVMLQMLVDKKTDRGFLVAIALADRVSIGDIDQQTGEILDGIYQEKPAIIFAQADSVWLQSKQRTIKQRYRMQQEQGQPNVSPDTFLLAEQLAQQTRRDKEEAKEKKRQARNRRKAGK
jgi:hypothetical protein